MTTSLRQRGFTLIELMVVISVIGILATVILSSLEQARMKANDTKRIQEITQVQTALELYYSDHGHYPDSDRIASSDWETPGEGDNLFLTALVNGGYIANIKDPTVNDDTGNYRYYRYPAGYDTCDPSKGAFYIIEISALQTSTGHNPGFQCTSAGRNWTTEGAYVVGKFENG